VSCLKVILVLLRDLFDCILSFNILPFYIDDVAGWLVVLDGGYKPCLLLLFANIILIFLDINVTGKMSYSQAIAINH